MMFVTGVTVILVACAVFAGCATEVPRADLVLINGKIVTADPERPEASAVAVRADSIVAVGSDEQIAQLVGPSTRTIDLAGNLAIPGLIEGHGHFMSLGQSKMILDLTTARSWDEIVGMVDEAVDKAEPGEWITGRGWHQEKWDSVPENVVDGVPTHQSLSEVSPDNPVYLRHASGHASFANAEAMRRSAISSETPDPPGGQIIKDVRGQPTGHLRETAQQLVARTMRQDLSERSDAEILSEKYRMAELATIELLENGITSLHDAGASFETITFYKRLVDEGRMPVRLYVMVDGENPSVIEPMLDDYRLIDYGNKLTVRSIKQYADGALGAHGAWLLEPYEDMPSTTGLNTIPIDSIRKTADVAVDHDYQLNTHAIGDRANREVLDIYEAALNHELGADWRWRIEHAQHLHPDDIRRFAELGVIASMQAVHATSDGPWVPKRLGEKRSLEGAYVWQSLWQSGAVVTNGTDVPVEDVDPMANFYSSVSRQLEDGTVFYPDQRLTREQALQAYTVNNAYAAFQENRLGSITPGKWADLTVLSRDIMTVPEGDIPGTQILYTIVGGEVQYQRSVVESEED